MSLYYNPSPSYRKPVKRKPVSLKTNLRELKKAVRELAKYDKELAVAIADAVNILETYGK